jgi:hypothetical protein
VWNRKIVFWLCWSYSFIKTYVMTNMIAHLECRMHKKNFIKWERKEWVNHVCLMSTVVMKHIQDMKTYLSTSTLQRIINLCSLKTQKVVWIMMVIEEWSTRAWSRWTIHQKRAIESLDVEVPDIMEKGKWMFESKISIMPWRVI